MAKVLSPIVAWRGMATQSQKVAQQLVTQERRPATEHEPEG
ncbi:hypothetical protein A2U01_0107174, partial [Trifolium medium]|nr:hypothetical protein [Trifolium medium]